MHTSVNSEEEVAETEHSLQQPAKAEKGSARYRHIRNCMLLSGLSVFAQLYLFQPLLSELCGVFDVTPATASLAVSFATIGMAVGLFIFAFRADAVSRERLMSFALIGSSVLTILTAFAWDFVPLLVLTLLKGIALSGVSAVALAYLNEEVSPATIGVAISLYLSGNTIGGMSGRVTSTLIAGWGDWRWSAGVIGLVTLLIGLQFARRIPHSQNFHPQTVHMKIKLRRMGQFLTQFSFLGLYLVAALVMGAFVSVYNYISFVLESPEFHLPHYIVAMIYMMYTVGVAGSVITGKLSDRYDAATLLKASVLLMLWGVVLLSVMKLWVMVLGLGMMTFAFFSAHTMACRLVSVRAKRSKSSATCLYWLFYYIGSSIIGSSTGVTLTHYGWGGFIMVIIAIVIVALILSFVATKGKRHPLGLSEIVRRRTVQA